MKAAQMDSLTVAQSVARRVHTWAAQTVAYWAAKLDANLVAALVPGWDQDWAQWLDQQKAAGSVSLRAIWWA